MSRKDETTSSREAPWDVVVVGSGFGGSVAALRLAEKGYRVVVLEAGRRFRDEDFPKTSWNLRRFVFMPRLGLQGIMRLEFFRGLTVLAGAGVGGGSLVYANTLMAPSEKAFATFPPGLGVDDWNAALAPHYATARRMLGVVRARATQPADEALRVAARALGAEATYREVDVGVFYGKPGTSVADPFFGGAGPERTGCTECGGCMVGCRVGAKNTLVKNYLYLAEKLAVRILERAEVTQVRPEGSQYVVTYRRPGILPGRARELRAARVVFAGGVMGTLKLLFRCRDVAKTLPNLSPTLGDEVRTNSEAIVAARCPGSPVDYSRGVAIAASFNPDEHTKIEAVRYPAGSDFMGLLGMPLTKGATLAARLWTYARFVAAQPLRYLRYQWPFGFARETVILLVMQTLDSRLRFRWRRRLTPDFGAGGRPPFKLPVADACAEAVAAHVGGIAACTVPDTFGMSFTAHILGGCPMGTTAATGVIDAAHRVHGYPGLYVVAGAAVPANLGVNPSLTITAMAERAMALVPAKGEGVT